MRNIGSDKEQPCLVSMWRRAVRSSEVNLSIRHADACRPPHGTTPLTYPPPLRTEFDGEEGYRLLRRLVLSAKMQRRKCTRIPSLVMRTTGEAGPMLRAYGGPEPDPDHQHDWRGWGASIHLQRSFPRHVHRGLRGTPHNPNSKSFCGRADLSRQDERVVAKT